MGGDPLYRQKNYSILDSSHHIKLSSCFSDTAGIIKTHLMRYQNTHEETSWCCLKKAQILLLVLLRMIEPETKIPVGFLLLFYSIINLDLRPIF